MRKEYGRILRNVFEKEMKSKLPQFELIKIKSVYIFPGERIFRWIPKSSLHCFIILSPSHKGYDEFTIEIGWSVLGRFPELSVRPSPVKSADENIFSRSEFICRLTNLNPDITEWWKFDHIEDPIDMLFKESVPISTGKAQKVVKACVEDAMDAIIRYGVPYLDRFIEIRKF